MKWLLLILIVLMQVPTMGQGTDTLEVISQVRTLGIVSASVDRQGYCYLADSAGSISKYDSEGKLVSVFQAKQVLIPDLLEAWNGLSVFQFYRQQKILLLDRFLTGDEPMPIANNSGLFASIAAPAQDGRIWAWDVADFSLKKIESGSGKEFFSSPLNLILKQNMEISFMREYENKLYVADTSGSVHVFDNAGTYLSKWNPKVKWFTFYADNMIYYRNDSLFSQSLYSNNIQAKTFSNLKGASYCMLTSKVLYAVIKRRLVVFKRPF